MSERRIVKVIRKLYPVGQMAEVEFQYGMSTRQWLTDEARHQMGGEREAYFEAEQINGKWVLFNAVKKPKRQATY